jgi:hypothetical protein
VTLTLAGLRPREAISITNPSPPSEGALEKRTASLPSARIGGLRASSSNS